MEQGVLFMYSIRYAREGDVPEILKIFKHYNMHHIPSPEMPELNVKFLYVAEMEGNIVGAAGFKILTPEIGKTTLLAVSPAFNNQGIGLALQAKRLQAMIALGCEKVITNADRPKTIQWYKKHFGYQEVGAEKKIHSFGDPRVDYWTTLEANLTESDLQPYLPKYQVPPLIINAALTGAVHSRKDNQYLPVTPQEIANDAVKAAAHGASVVHLHARDHEEKPTTDPSIYKEIILRIREKNPDLIICTSTSGRGVKHVESRAAVLFLQGESKPDMASLTLGSMNFPREASINSPDTIGYLAGIMRERNIKPEAEVFDLGMFDYARYLIRKEILDLPLYSNTVLGSLGTLAAREKNLELLRRALPPDTVWSVTGIGRYQRKMIEWAVKNGAHVRVGLEDNLYMDEQKKTLASNLDLIRMVREIAEKHGRAAASPGEARKIIGL